MSTSSPIDYVVDFESYYDTKAGISAKTSGVRNYVRDSDAYLISIVGPDTRFVGGVEEAQEKFPAAFWEAPSHRFWAANANFDESWVRKYWPEASAMRPWYCVLDLGAAQQLPHNLAGMAKVLFGKKVDKTLRDWMDGRRYEELPDEDKAALQQYCLQDSEEEYRILRALPPLSPMEEKIAAHTRMTNLRGVRVDVARVEQDRIRLLEWRHAAEQRLPWVAAGVKPLSPTAFAEWAQECGLPIPASLAKDDEECAELVGAHPKLSEMVDNLRRFRKANTMLTKLEAVLARVDENDEMPIELMYCGARHTRRWSSRGVNIQNLDREPYWLTEDGRPDDSAWNVWSRRWMIPRPGKKFLILDLSQIEPRCLNWMVGNEPLLARIRQGFGLYEAYARAVGKWTDPAPLKKADPGLYKSIKAQVLGLGYGMGAARYRSSAAASGVELTDDEAARDVTDWRTANPLITGLWKSLDADIQRVIREPQRILSYEMPNGELMRHFDVKAHVTTFPPDEEGRVKTKASWASITTRGDFSPRSRQLNLWGGTLTENLTQRMARDVFAEAIVRLEAAGFPVLWHAHDEVILEVDDTCGDADKEEALRILRQPPEWAPDLPLDAEGDYAATYTK